MLQFVVYLKIAVYISICIAFARVIPLAKGIIYYHKNLLYRPEHKLLLTIINYDHNIFVV